MARASKKTGDEQVGARIAARRRELDMSREDLANEVGASYAFVSQIETGWRMPSHEKQRLIARALGSGLDELFGDDLEQHGYGAAMDAAFEPDAPAAGLPEFLALSESAGRPAPASPRLPAAAPAARSFSEPSASARSVRPATAKPTFDEAVERAGEALRELPASRRLDALSRLQLIVMREVADEERRRSAPATGWITELAPDEVFVFGSNEAGLHGGGAARTAFEKFGAIWGQGRGHHGQTYAIVSMSGLAVLREEVAEFLAYAARHPELRFLVTPIGTGIAGHRIDEVAPLFAAAPENVILPAEFDGA